MLTKPANAKTVAAMGSVQWRRKLVFLSIRAAGVPLGRCFRAKIAARPSLPRASIPKSIVQECAERSHQCSASIVGVPRTSLGSPWLRARNARNARTKTSLVTRTQNRADESDLEATGPEDADVFSSPTAFGISFGFGPPPFAASSAPFIRAVEGEDEEEEEVDDAEVEEDEEVVEVEEDKVSALANEGSTRARMSPIRCNKIKRISRLRSIQADCSF
jgi:hypothetical protein